VSKAKATNAEKLNTFDDLVSLVERLRAPGGCPWDRKQTHRSLKGALLEEACEVIVEIEQGNAAGLRDELGDLLLHVVFHAQIAQENGEFTLSQVVEGIVEKLVRRHPHVFGDETAQTPEEVKQTWERVKEAEGKGAFNVSSHLPALVAARKLQDRAANAKQALPLPFDLEGLRPMLRAPAEQPERAIGELLFSVVALARELEVEPEWALAKTLRSLEQAA